VYVFSHHPTVARHTFGLLFFFLRIKITFITRYLSLQNVSNFLSTNVESCPGRRCSFARINGRRYDACSQVGMSSLQRTRTYLHPSHATTCPRCLVEKGPNLFIPIRTASFHVCRLNGRFPRY
jgi:hypothetical protein